MVKLGKKIKKKMSQFCNCCPIGRKINFFLRLCQRYYVVNVALPTMGDKHVILFKTKCT